MIDRESRIPRAEVEEMGRVVMAELSELAPGCVSTIVGGYRRGKPESNDVDIVFTHPDAGVVKGLCKRFVRRLYEQGRCRVWFIVSRALSRIQGWSVMSCVRPLYSIFVNKEEL